MEAKKADPTCVHRHEIVDWNTTISEQRHYSDTLTQKCISKYFPISLHHFVCKSIKVFNNMHHIYFFSCPFLALECQLYKVKKRRF